MCNFFSFNSDGKGNYDYFSLSDIQEYKKSHPAWQEEKREGWSVPGVNFHSHSFIAQEKRGKGEKDFNTYEFFPQTGQFVVDTINVKVDDRKKAEKWVRALFSSMTKDQIWEYYKESYSLDLQFRDLPTKEKVLLAIRRGFECAWFNPMGKVPKKKAEVSIRLACKLFGVEAEVEYRTLRSPEDWDAAQDAARGAARDAAWDAARDAAWGAARGAAWGAAWGAAFEVASDLPDLRKKYPENPFGVLMDLWEMGFYVCGVIDGKFLLYYVPKK